MTTSQRRSQAIGVQDRARASPPQAHERTVRHARVEELERRLSRVEAEIERLRSQLTEPGTPTAGSVRQARSRRPFALVFAAVLPIIALVVWVRSVNEIDLRAMDDLGLASVLPVAALITLALLTLSFCWVLRAFPSNTTLMLLYLVVLAVMLYGATAFVEEVPRFAVSWRHAGIADHIARTGAVDTKIDAYFNWPGFFTLAALLTELAGFDNPISFARWTSVYANLLFLAPLILILRAATDDTRLIWLATWIFFLTNWVGQDYFSPQAFTYFLYLVILAILLTWFRRRAGLRTRGPREEEGDNPEARQRLSRRLRVMCSWDWEAHEEGDLTTPDRRVGLMAIVVLAFAVMVASHQLTPFVALFSVTALVGVRRCTARGLPVLMTVLAVTWVGFMAVAYLKGHAAHLTAGLGDVSSNAGANVGNRLRGTPEHLLVVRVRLALTAGLWGLALVGAVRRLRHGHRDLACAVLALAPFSAVAMQSYGGEILLRIYLFALPFVVFFAAAAFLPSVKSATSWPKTALVGFSTLAMLGSFLFARYGNERANQFSRSEVQAIDHLYSIAPKGSILLAGSENTPWRYHHYNEYRHLTLTTVEKQRQQPLPRLEDVTSLASHHASKRFFVVITRSQKAHVELLGVWPPGALQALESQLGASSGFPMVFANRDATVFEARHE